MKKKPKIRPRKAERLMRISPTFLMLFFLFAIAVAPHAKADIYYYTDKSGVRHFTNTPTSPQYRIFIRGNTFSPSTVRLSNRYDHYIRKASAIHDVDFDLVKALIKVESDFNYRAVSSAGAMGLMQIMPENFRLLNVRDPFDPWENILGGTKYLRKMLDQFNNELSMALAAYNAGPCRVEENNCVPPIPETQDYVKNVLRYYKLIRNQ
jgi:soluble lytic murein transglycosylase-like protein